MAVLSCLLLLVSSSSGWAELTLGNLGLLSQEYEDFNQYPKDLRYLMKMTARIKNFDDHIAVREARGSGNMDGLIRGLRSDFKSAAVNCTMAALKNVTKVDKIIKMLPRGPLKKKMTRILRSPKTQKLLKNIDDTRESIEGGMEKLEEIRDQAEQVSEFLEASANEGVHEALRQELIKAVRSEVENIFPLDLDQPVNEVVVDGFIELSKYFPATAPFTALFESTAAMTKKQVRVYAQSLEFDAIAGNVKEFRIIRLRNQESRHKFADSPLHACMLRHLAKRIRFLGSIPLGKEEEKRRLEKEREATRRRLTEGKKKLTGRFYLARHKGNDGPSGDFYLYPTGKLKSLTNSQRVFRWSASRVIGFKLGMDQLSLDLVGGEARLKVDAKRRRVVEVVSATELSGHPDCGAWRGASWETEGVVSAERLLKVDGSVTLSGDSVLPARPGEGQVSLGLQGLEREGESRFSVGFSWEETNRVGSNSRGQDVYKTVTEHESRNCKYPKMKVKDLAPDRVWVGVTGLDHLEIRDRVGQPLEDGAVYDFDPTPRAIAFLDNGEVYSQEIPRIEEGFHSAGLVVQEIDPKPETGTQRMKLWIQDSTGKKLLSRNYSIHCFRWKLTLEGAQISEPSMDFKAHLFGEGDLRLEIEGPINDGDWRVDWGAGGDLRDVVYSKGLSYGIASVTFQKEKGDERRSFCFNPVLKYKVDGRSCYGLLPSLQHLNATIMLRAPRFRKLEVRQRNGTAMGLGEGGKVHGVHFYSIVPSAHGRPITAQRGVAFEAVFEDEFGTLISASDRLPGGVRLRNSIFDIDYMGGIQSSLQVDHRGRILAVRSGTGPGIARVNLEQPLITHFAQDQRLVFHPDFHFVRKQFFLLLTTVTMAKTVDFTQGKPALMMVLEGPGKGGGFQVAWPQYRGDPIRTELFPYPRRDGKHDCHG
jgi:hypothetical protein